MSWLEPDGTAVLVMNENLAPVDQVAALMTWPARRQLHQLVNDLAGAETQHA